VPEKVTVQWLEEKCPNPQECRECLKICPSTVFVLYATDREPYKKQEHWVITPSFQNFCIACYKCTEVCPNDAIKIEVTEAD
jgi:formate hydrogenlyase subunit 6/NADH:ubiquinone oxidoreductase subunit I